jgi:hypothetical protein
MTMSKLIKIVGLGFAGVGLGFAGVGLAAPAHADAKQDQEFYRLLTEPDQDHPMVIWNFALVRSWGIGACELEDAGVTPYQATKDLQSPNGPYITFDDANNVASSAETIYCPWHHAGMPGSGLVNASAPVFPRPVYPPLAWLPSPAYPSYPPPVGYVPYG